MLTTAWGPVGTRGGCGAGWGPGACPDGNAIHWGLRGANSSHPNQDKHQALSSTPPRPLYLQDPGPQAPQPGQAPGPLIHSTPPLVPTGPCAASTSMDRIPRFGRQYSLGVHLAHPHTLNKQLPYELCGGWNMLMMFPAGSLIVKARPKGSSVGWLTISTPLETNVA